MPPFLVCDRIRFCISKYLLIPLVYLILVDGGRRVRRPVTPNMIESEAGRRLSATRMSISDVRISAIGHPCQKSNR